MIVSGVSEGDTVSVVIPSYRRPDRLLDCLHGLQRSTRRPDEVVVVVRSEDEESIAAVRVNAPQAKLVLVDEPGVLAAMTAGAREARGRIIAFIDDDAVPKADWLSRILACLEDERVGGAGGRDIVTNPDVLPRTTVAGCFDRSGKLIGNHHTVIGPPRDVQVLKAANMAFKRDALALPAHLLGKGAQVHFEVATCLWARQRGWRLVLDPGAEVLHLPGERFDADIRVRPSLGAAYRMAFNLTWCLLSMRPPILRRAMIYALVVGDRSNPGFVRTAVALLRGERSVLRRVLPSLAGQLHAIVVWITGHDVPMVTFTTEAN